MLSPAKDIAVMDIYASKSHNEPDHHVPQAVDVKTEEVCGFLRADTKGAFVCHNNGP